ncbi:hypothetical protein K1719_035087 [Acacia pycnantha]|nr:hypothetical protein K1719_035087 [Acacia pycnantha]
MLVEGCKPNVITHTTLIDGLCKAGHIEKACQICARIRGTIETSDVDIYFRSNDNSCEKPNVITCGALVDGLCKANQVKEAHELLIFMSVEGCEPNHIVYEALIDGFCKAGKLEDGQEVFAKMSERGSSPNLHTYGSLIDVVFKDKRLDLVLKVLSKILENSCVPNVVIYTEMIDGLCEVVTYTVMINGVTSHV